MPLSFHNNRSFWKKIDSLPAGAPWHLKSIHITGDRTDENGNFLTEDLELWFRNPVDVVRELFGNPLFKDLLNYRPYKMWMEEMGKTRCINEMWTADWWWELQVCFKISTNASI